MTLTVEELLREGPPQVHFGLFAIGSPDIDAPIIACASAIPHADGSVKIRQVAVATAQQGQGWGKTLMDLVEHELRYVGDFHTIQLHARLNVQTFYEKLGYIRQGEVFEEIGIPHVLMVKRVG
jgi:predicted GNAT family N-acyltransferase